MLCRLSYILSTPKLLVFHFIPTPLLGLISKLTKGRDYISGKQIGNEILCLLNIHDKENKLNILDGIVLAIALRYAVEKVREKLPGVSFTYKVVDLRGESSNAVNLLTTFKDLKFAAIVSAAELSQTNFVLQLYGGETYKIPIFSPLTSSSAFNRATETKSNGYSRVFQTLPTEEIEVKAIIDILLRFNWTYVSIINSRDSFKQRSVYLFLSMAKRNKICIGTQITVSENDNGTISKDFVRKLNSFQKANIVVLFTLSHVTRKVLEAFENNTKFHFVSDTGWRSSIYTVKESLNIAKGSLILQYSDVFDEEFEHYFLKQNLGNSKNDNFWFKEFWEQVFSCDTGSFYGSELLNRSKCTGNERLNASLVEIKHAIVKPLIVAIDSMACTVTCMIAKGTCSLCNKYKTKFHQCITAHFEENHGKCNCQNRSGLFQSQSVSSHSSSTFQILNFDGQQYTTVGTWTLNSSSKETSLNLNTSEINWKDNRVPQAFCYQTCKDGEVPYYGTDANACCFSCMQCHEDEITLNGTCLPCGKHKKPSYNKKSCYKLPLVYINNRFYEMIAIKLGSCIGLAINSATVFLFIKYRDTKIIKATSIELSMLILLALYLCFLSPWILFMRPSLIICGMQRFIIGLSCTACYTPLMLKTNRIYRIFKASEKLNTKPFLVSTKSQILICCGFISLQLLLCVVWVAGSVPKIQLLDVDFKNQTAVLCMFETINIVFNLLPCLLMMGACTLFAYKTRNFPSNFNEAFKISVTMYISCFLWGIFIPLLFLFEMKDGNVFLNAILISCFMIAIGIVTVVGIFGPTLARLFLSPSKNRASSKFFYSENELKSDTNVSSRDVSIAQEDWHVSKQQLCETKEKKVETSNYRPMDDEKSVELKCWPRRRLRRRSQSF